MIYLEILPMQYCPRDLARKTAVDASLKVSLVIHYHEDRVRIHRNTGNYVSLPVKGLPNEETTLNKRSEVRVG